MISIFSGPLITKKYTKSIFTRKESHLKRVLSFRKANTLKLVNKSDFKVEELIADNIVVLAEGVQGRSKLCFPSTIYRLCKESGVPIGEFKNSDQIQIARPITAKVMTTTRGRIIDASEILSEIRKATGKCTGSPLVSALNHALDFGGRYHVSASRHRIGLLWLVKPSCLLSVLDFVKLIRRPKASIINQPQNQPMEEEEDNYDAENLYTNHEQN
ncbi:hypothetical protein PIB30_095669 [Stylosanthes scabra]|uniref:Uncharacterized protein n=1 Tax=Stylosanthes scabra TaxID=79078 RepID=A0ABU6UZD7_9FABA|nr:hypothetical protein [Stylosanthes scabra]